MAFDDSSNARRKRKVAKQIQQSIAKVRAGYRAKRREAEAAKRAKENQVHLLALPQAVPATAHQAPALPALNLTPEDIAAIWKVAREHREVAA